MRVAIYARFSRDIQNDRSVEDQVRICRERISKENGWRVIEVYSDHALSGAGMAKRAGLQSLMRDAASGYFDLVVSEALDRVSRDQADTATLYKRLTFHGIKILTLSENWVGPMEVGLKGLMNQLFLDDLKHKVRRGQRGNVESGKIAAGLSYGYEVVRKFDAKGELVRGERKINAEHAAIIHRIFQEYDAGKSPRAIAIGLNKDGIAAPRGGKWNPSTIHGRIERGYGILCNPLYSGRIVWNRVREDKEPDTLRRIPRVNDKEEWIEKEAPE
ncbi:MAG: recombinase family protein, partial [Bryobacterales bacterium]